MKCERHTKLGLKPNDFPLSQLTFIDYGMVAQTTIKRRIALCRECYQAHVEYKNDEAAR